MTSQNNITLYLNINFTDCPNSVIEVVRSDRQKVNTIVGKNQSVTFMDSTSTPGICTVYAVLNSGVRVTIGSFSCRMSKYYTCISHIIVKVCDTFHGLPVDMIHESQLVSVE